MKVARAWIIVVAAACVAPLASCKKKVEAPAAEPAKAVAPEGPLTLARLKQARLLVKVPGRFSDAVSAVEASLGPPASREATRAGWSVLAGQDCHELVIDAHPNGAVRAAGITSANQAMKARHDACAAKADTPTK